jgi:branched-chain amino acid transport system permease protein
MRLGSRAMLFTPRASSALGFIAFAVLLLLAPTMFGSGGYLLTEYEEVLSLLIVVIALNIAMGYAGQFLLGIPAVFALGAYPAALLAEHHPAGVGLFVMCVVSLVGGALGGLIIGLPALRVSEFYLGLVSLFATLVIPTVASQWNAIGGASGISLYSVPGFQPKLSGQTLYFIIAAIVLVVTALSWALLRSRPGRRFIILRSSGELAMSLGISPYRTKLLAILLSSALAGLGGGVYVYTQQFFSPASTSTSLAILLLAAVIIGGLGTVSGPIVGGLAVLGLNQFFTAFQSSNGIVFGALLVLFAVFLPDGAVSRISAFVRPRIRRASDAATFDLRKAPGPSTDAFRSDPAPTDAARDSQPLVIKGVHRSFGGVRAVQGIDLIVERGSVHGLIGSNGSGKTTLLNLISGFYRVDEGEIRLGDLRLDRIAPYLISRAGIVRTFQSPKLIGAESALNNIVPAAELHTSCLDIESVLRLPRGVRQIRAAKSQAWDALSAVGLGTVVQETGDALPHGTRRLVELARALALRPSFVLLDEPGAGLSPSELEILAATITRMADSGVGVLLIEHNVPLVLDIAQQVTVLHQGKRLFAGSPAELRANKEVAESVLGVGSGV